MRDLTSPTAIWTKGILFLLLGVGSALMLLAEAGTPKVALLLVVAMWGFCRAYYFAFYVIETGTSWTTRMSRRSSRG